MIRNDITGQIFGLLIVNGYAHGGKNSHWHCTCECGAKIIVPLPNLKSGNTTKCNAVFHMDGQNLADITGKSFGRLKVVSIKQKARPRLKDGTQLRTLWDCICECGNPCVVDAQNLKSGHTRSCGCLLIDTNTTHGCCAKDLRLYGIWRNMISRCENENDSGYSDYGERGITVCNEWHDVSIFFEWAYKSGYVYPLTIERVNVDLNYFPNNCTWIPQPEQNWNKRNSVGVANVRIIRQMGSDGYTTKQISEYLSLKQATVRLIKNGHYYKGI